MTIVEFVKLFIPPIVPQLIYRLRSPQKVSVTNPSTIRNIKKKGETLVVIGNGPSLTETINTQSEQIRSKDCIVVNGFCKTEYYEKIKPALYLIADPDFFVDDISKSKRVDAEGVLINLIKKTTWKVNLIVPHTAQNSYFIKKINENAYIHVLYYNNYNLGNVCNLSKHTKFELWDENLVPPPAQTCLNTSVWLGIYLRYKQIYLIGADTTWMELLHVDQETNQVYTIETHFYEEKKIYLYRDADENVPQKLHEELNCISRALSYYWELKYYADYAGVEVYNASSYSLIDAFERKKIAEE